MESSETPRQAEYAASVDGQCHASAHRIIGELEQELAEAKLETAHNVKLYQALLKAATERDEEARDLLRSAEKAKREEAEGRIAELEAALLTERDYVRSMDRVIDDEHIARSCISPLEDLKRAVHGLKLQAEKAERALASAQPRAERRKGQAELWLIPDEYSVIGERTSSANRRQPRAKAAEQGRVSRDALQRCAVLLRRYAEVARSSPHDDLERYDYIPEIEECAEIVDLAAAALPSLPADGAE